MEPIIYFSLQKIMDEIFRIGVATSSSPEGPFKPQPTPIKKSFSIDPAVFKDDDGSYYMYFGGIWGGQLQRWRTGPSKQKVIVRFFIYRTIMKQHYMQKLQS
jgi:beta-xylosidase